MMMRKISAVVVTCSVSLLAAQIAFGDEPAAGNQQKQAAPVPLNKQKTVLLDLKNKRLYLKGQVVLRQGLLEMLACLQQTKEHESILAVDTKAYVVHTGLLALGIKSGKPVQFEPKYQPPTGQEIAIYLNWTDEKGRNQRVAAQSWVQNAVRRFYTAEMKALPEGLTLDKKTELRFDAKHNELSWYGHMTVEQRDELLKLSPDKSFKQAVKSFFEQSQPKQMDAKWVFAGSGFFTDEQSGKKLYEAEGGDLICVANFPSATLDVAIASSASGEQNLLYEAYTKRIPPLETEVTIELVPVFMQEKQK